MEINNNVSVMFGKYIMIVGITNNISVTFDKKSKMKNKNPIQRDSNHVVLSTA